MSGALLISCIRFSIQLFIGESIFTLGWNHREQFWLRLAAGRAGYFAAAVTVYKVCASIPGTNPVVYFGIVRRNTGKGEMRQRDTRIVLLDLGTLFTVIVISVLVDTKVFGQNYSLLQNVYCKL